MLLVAGASVHAQNRLSLSPVRGTSKIKIGYLKRSVVIDLDDELIGGNGSLPGDEPHRFTVLFTTEKEGFLYMVAKVCSTSPISDKNAPCGGDRPCAVLWIKIDKALINHEIQCQIYESCSYNYYDSKVTLTRTGLVIRYGGGLKEMTYDNAAAEKGLVVSVAAQGH